MLPVGMLELSHRPKSLMRLSLPHGYALPYSPAGKKKNKGG